MKAGGRIIPTNGKFRRVAGMVLLGTVLAVSGCQKARHFFQRPGQGVTSASHPAGAYTYDLPLVMHTSPEELLNYYGKDMSWLEKGSSALEVEFSGGEAHTDMTVIGHAVDFHFRILGIRIPCRMICLKYRPERELWWMMIMPDTGWILLRFNVGPDEAGTRLHLGVVGQIDEKMRPLLDNPVFMTALAARADQLMTLIQAQFDPTLDVDQVLSHGLRGELAQTVLLDQRSEIWIQARPEAVRDWALEPENLARILEGFKLGPRYYEEIKNSAPGDVVFAPAVFESGLLKLEVETVSLRMDDLIRMYVATSSTVEYIEAEVSPRQGGTQLRVRFGGEVPAGGSAQAMNMLMFVSGIPSILQERALMIKKGVEGEKG